MHVWAFVVVSLVLIVVAGPHTPHRTPNTQGCGRPPARAR